MYDIVLALTYPNGVLRVINGTDFLSGEPVTKIDHYGEIVAVGRSRYNAPDREPS